MTRPKHRRSHCDRCGHRHTEPPIWVDVPAADMPGYVRLEMWCYACSYPAEERFRRVAELAEPLGGGASDG